MNRNANVHYFEPSNNSIHELISKFHPQSQAMRVVRTVGQAFEVCHKLSIQKKSQEPNDDNSELISDLDQSDIQNLSDFDEPKKGEFKNSRKY